MALIKSNDRQDINDNVSASQGSDQEVQVLYQKMGDRWFAFSLIGEEVFVGSISQEEIDALESQSSRTVRATRSGILKKRTGNA